MRGSDTAVPTADSANNAKTSEVIGNKTDTTGGDSLVSLVKIVDELHDVPQADSADNATVSDVCGNKTDTTSGNSIVSLVKIVDGVVDGIESHNHVAQKVYPTLAAGVTLTAGGPAWTLGAFVVIVAANTITSIFDIHGVEVEAISNADMYELVLYSGADAAEVEIGRVRFGAVGPKDMKTVRVAANSQIKGKIACATAAEYTGTVSLRYHTA